MNVEVNHQKWEFFKCSRYYDLGILFSLLSLIFRCEELRLHIELIIKDHQKSANVKKLVWQFSQNINCEKLLLLVTENSWRLSWSFGKESRRLKSNISPLSCDWLPEINSVRFIKINHWRRAGTMSYGIMYICHLGFCNSYLENAIFANFNAYQSFHSLCRRRAIVSS